MATPGQLADTLSETLGIRAGTIHFYGQYLRDAGLLSKGGRGRSAISVSRGDAINWLVAMCSAETAKSAPGVVELTVSTPRHSVTWTKGSEADTPNPHGRPRFLGAGSVGELLDCLLDDERAGRLDPILLTLDFYVGGGRVELNAAGFDGVEPGIVWSAEMSFIHSFESLSRAGRRRDHDETPITAKRHALNRIGKGVLEDINGALALAEEAVAQ